jgi:C4-dicarboxylate-specific signal transduction histidine kinase
MSPCDQEEKDVCADGRGPSAALFALVAAVGVLAAIWLLRRRKFNLMHDIEFIMSECDRAAERMERSVSSRAQAS